MSSRSQPYKRRQLPPMPVLVLVLGLLVLLVLAGVLLALFLQLQRQQLHGEIPEACVDEGVEVDAGVEVDEAVEVEEEDPEAAERLGPAEGDALGYWHICSLHGRWRRR